MTAELLVPLLSDDILMVTITYKDDVKFFK